ncbi:unnamed protein product [Paramecium octaurelia]|uniref:Uncharacterized protein n=1 Tax=Paramecium octaurelia TaxID=43137 RepID=A0A8S1WZC1_PAROT|nr:unnamed protein product [Paramecium octaurelia]
MLLIYIYYGQECSFKCECTEWCNKQTTQLSNKIYLQVLLSNIKVANVKSKILQKSTVNVQKEIKDVLIILATNFIKLSLRYQILANYQVNFLRGLDFYQISICFNFYE